MSNQTNRQSIFKTELNIRELQQDFEIRMGKRKRQNHAAQIPGPGLVPAPPYHGMDDIREKRAIKLGQARYRILKRIVAPEANRFLVGKGLPSAANIDFDFKKTMALIQKKVSADPYFLVRHMTESQLRDDRAARNEADHEDFQGLLDHESKHCSILKDFCECVGSNAAAINVQRHYNLAQIDDWPRLFSFSFVFTPTYDENVAFSLCEIIFAVISIYLAFEMYEVRKVRDPQAIDPPPIDSHENLTFFQQQQLANVDYLAPDGAIRGDTATLKGSFAARIENRHSHHTKTFINWKLRLNDIIKLLDVFGATERARAVESIRDRLITAETNGTVVTDSIFPELFR